MARDSGQGYAAMMVPVKIMFATGDRVVIEATGLEPGELAIVEGNESLFPMAPVAPFTRENKKP